MASSNGGEYQRFREQQKSGPGLYRILLTGGPCAGKTTMMAKLTSVLDNKGYRVFCVPEAATLMMQGGAQLDTSQMNWDFAVQMQTAVLQMQMNLEDSFTNIAMNEQNETQKPTLVLCDRGLLDGSAYVEPELWHQIMDEQNFAGLNLIEKRYDAVIHMVTAAEGAEEFYNFSNEARYENAEGARMRDKSLMEAYLGHRKFMIVDNQSTNFEDKIRKGIGLIKSVVGLPTDTQIFKKYLVSGHTLDTDIPQELYQEHMTILETYLKLDKSKLRDQMKQNMTACVRQRKKQGLLLHNYEKRYTVGSERIQEMRSITAKEYFHHVKNKSNERGSILKERTCFVYKTQSFMLEKYADVPGQPTVLRVDTSNRDVDLPPFITIEKDITNDRSYSSASLAVKKAAATTSN